MTITAACWGFALETTLIRDPVYQQLTARLREQAIRQFRPGDQFLTERQIVERFGVSRATANKALAGLVSEGLLEFRKGVGTFVRASITYDVSTLVSFTEKARAAGKLPATEVIAFRSIPGSELERSAREALGSAVTETAQFWLMDRLRTADGVPVILEHRLVVGAHCPRLIERDLQGSLYEAWTVRHGLKIGGADEIIRAVSLTRREAALLRVPSRSAALEVRAVGFLSNGSPLWWERTLYRADMYEFHTRLGPIRHALPARGFLRSGMDKAK
ncbi:MAG: GntR family transcriptional regulator [Gemmataceae bacterium]